MISGYCLISFDGIMETIVRKEEIIEVKKYAREAAHVILNFTGSN
jgi:hypothetical protein